MSAAGLVVIVLALLLLRQNLFVILGCVTGYAYFVFAGEPVDGIILDAWSALNKDILLSIPLYILAGNIMASGGIAGRLIRFMRALHVSQDRGGRFLKGAPPHPSQGLGTPSQDFLRPSLSLGAFLGWALDWPNGLLITCRGLSL